MNVHKNARLTPLGRERIVMQVESGQTPQAAAQATGVCPRTVRKWLDRYRREGSAGLKDRSSRPHRPCRPTLQAVIETIERLRRQRWTGKQIAAEFHTALSDTRGVAIRQRHDEIVSVGRPLPP
jgi:transposase-like protein